MAFFYGIPDYQAYMEHLSYMRRFINPYVEDRYYSKYPAGYFLFMGLLGLMGADSFWQLKLALSFFDVLNIFTCYYICKDIFKIESESRILCILGVYFYNYIHLLNRISGENDVVSIAMLLLAIYFFLKSQYGKSGLFLSFGVNFKVFPIFFLIHATLYFLKNKEIKQCIKYWAIQAIGFIAISSFYLFQDPLAFIKSLLIHTSRVTTGNSWFFVVQPIYDKPLNIFGIAISYMFIIQISVLLLIFVFGWVKFKSFGKNEIIIFTIFTLSVYPLITNYDVKTIFDKFMLLSTILIVSTKTLDFNKIKRTFNVLCLIHLVSLSILLYLEMNLPTGSDHQNPLGPWYGYYDIPYYHVYSIFCYLSFAIVILSLFGYKDLSVYYLILYNIILFIANNYVSSPEPTDDLLVPFIFRTIFHLVCLVMLFILYSRFKSTDITTFEDYEKPAVNRDIKGDASFKINKLVMLKLSSANNIEEKISIMERYAEINGTEAYLEFIKEVLLRDDLLEGDPNFVDFVNAEKEESENMNLK
jgi:hypothetical protein